MVDWLCVVFALERARGAISIYYDSRMFVTWQLSTCLLPGTLDDELSVDYYLGYLVRNRNDAHHQRRVAHLPYIIHFPHILWSDVRDWQRLGGD